MKRIGNLFFKICAFENLVSAFLKARKAKRSRFNVAAFEYRQEKEILRLQQELLSQTYQPGSYKVFKIFKPKPRLISAAPFKDRVVHHALCNIIEPLFEKTFIHDSYANRKNKGVHKAVNRYTEFCRKNRYVLKCDIKKFFSSIDHQILFELISRKIKCPSTLWLIKQILNNSNPQEPIYDYFPDDDLFTPLERRKGLPLGNLTSQFLANLYLNPLDHFVKENLKCGCYIRYVDDFTLLDQDKKRLWEYKKKIEKFLCCLRLKLHPKKCYVIPVAEGLDFLGYRVFPSYRRLRKENLIRFFRRIKSLQAKYREGITTKEQIAASLAAWIGYASHANAGGLIQNILQANSKRKVRS